MRRHVFDLGVLLGLATLLAVYGSLASPGLRSAIVHVYLLVVGALALFALVAATRSALPREERSELERALDERIVRDRPLPQVERMERTVSLATASDYDLHFRLLPHLRDIATTRLERRGQRLSPETAGRWWPLLDPDRPAPDNRFEGGISAADLRALVADLEKI